MKRHILFVMLLAVLLLSCGSFGDQNGEEGPDATPTTEPAEVIETTEVTEATPTTETEVAAATPTSEPTEQPQATATDTVEPTAPADSVEHFGDIATTDSLDSYRERLTMKFIEADGALGELLEEQVIETVSVREPKANHIRMLDSSMNVMVEMITISDTTWMNMGDGTWLQTPADEQESVDSADFEQDIESLLDEMSNNMTLVGTETVNDIQCEHFTVNSDISFKVPFPEEEEEEEAGEFVPSEIEGHIEGDIWLANEDDLPRVIIRSQTTQDLTIKYASREEKMIYREERDLYEINQAITIEPPENVLEIPMEPDMSDESELPSEEPSASDSPLADEQASVGDIEVASLESLDSYRAEMSYQTGPAEALVEMTFVEEWVREPPASHLIMSSQGMPLIEYVMIGNQFWMKVGDSWIMASEEQIDDETRDQLAKAMTPDEQMTLVGTENVNGIDCQHYVSEIEISSILSHKEIWVADEEDLPPVVVRAVARTEMGMGEETIITQSESNLVEINGSLTIEPPDS